ncbi:LORF11 [anatid alphaherpesvirus 1]|uniref:LORF11 n=1 Tax=anatid alphaherpesvirus 1 TaxID=104388 RepID=A7LA96_9ALPH|nr:LORF11 [Anatid alphaherpesvirus 1]AHD45922.1 LORF11 [BAC cloning vector pDEV-vac]ABS19575.1 LORF11 [Anatid alphaherpesvirus 1]AGS78661.1 LORF11 [Anatid alphaherpesvirus 1]AGW24797.1 unknown [Anatid alphaherpesvirus 1]UJO49795.1 LORF11 [Anatid alphaherpesvirus 1]
MESHNTYGRYIDHINCEVWDLGRQIPHNDLMGYDNTTAQPNRPRSTSSAAIFERSVENGRFTVEGRANRRNETLYDNSSDESDTEFISLLTTDGDDWTNDRRDCGIPPPAYDELSILSTSDDMHHDRTEESVTHCESLSRRDYYIANGHPRRQNVERPPDYFTSLLIHPPMYEESSSDRRDESPPPYVELPRILYRYDRARERCTRTEFIGGGLIFVVMNCNYFKYGFLFHLHCLPCQRREKLVVEILRRAIEDAQKYKSTSTWFNVYRYTRDDY